MGANDMNRRGFLKTTAAVAAGAALSGVAMNAQAQAQPENILLNGVQLNRLPSDRPDAERFALAKELGFNGIEASPMKDLDAAKRLGDAAREAGVPIHSIMYGGWQAPFSDPAPAVIEKGKAGLEEALRTAQAVGADTVLLVPAVVNEKVRYGEAWERSQENIRTMLPLAESLKVVIAVENVWNKFLLSPLEFARYVDEFDSPWLKAYFDVANVVLFGYPQDWIRTLGKRICKLHIKDFKRDGYQWVKLPFEGDVNFIEVRNALIEVGYTGWGTEEFPGGDVEHLRELARRMTMIGEGRSL